MPALQGINPFARPDNQLVKLWELYLNTLQADYWLSSGVKTWQIWDGEDNSYLPWTPDLCPILRVTPQAGAWMWTDETRHKGTITLVFDLGIRSRNVEFLWDFFECIHRALFPGDDPNTSDILNQSLMLGGIQKTTSGMALDPKLFADETCLGATGRIDLNCWLNS